MKSRYTLGELAELLDLQCVGDQALLLTGLATLSSATPDQLSFLANSKYLPAIKDCRAGALILSPEVATTFSGNCLISEQPYLSYAKASRLFEAHAHRSPGIHPTAVVSAHAQVAATASIGPHCFIGERAVIGDRVTIGPGCVIGDDSTISDGSLLHARVTLYQGVYIGHRVVIHSGTVIGSDGFGFAPTKQGWEKIAQLGGVRIGDDVEIGANTTIDRGALDDTVIGNGVIIDNLVQIAHNVTIGDYSAIAGCTGIAGSAKIGKRCTLAGRSNIVGHISIADGTHVTANSMITKSIVQAGSYSSGTPMQETKDWKKNAVRFARLHEMYERLVKLEKRLK